MRRLTPWQTQKAVVYALFFREMRTRFGGYKLGYFWALLEPLAHIAILSFIFGMRGRQALPHVDFSVFIATGIIPWLFFVKVINSLPSAISANSGLLAYRQVKPLDFMVTRLLLETLIHGFVLGVVLSVFSFMGKTVEVADPLGVILVLALLVVFAFSVGLLFSLITSVSSDIGKVLPIIVRLFYFFSGIFFTVEMIPDQYHRYLLMNPIAHFMELIHASFFSSYGTCHGNYLFLSVVTLFVLAVSLWLYDSKKEELRQLV